MARRRKHWLYWLIVWSLLLNLLPPGKPLWAQEPSADDTQDEPLQQIYLPLIEGGTAEASTPGETPVDENGDEIIADDLTVLAAGLPHPASTCDLYPIALHAQTLVNLAPGTPINDILNGAGAGNFGWLTWNGKHNVGYLVAGLTPPGNAHTYRNPNDGKDHRVSVGDWVQGRPGVVNSKAIRNALNRLRQLDVTVPVWGAIQGNGTQAQYQITNFALVRLTDYRLPGQNRISVQFLGYNPTCGQPHAPVAVADAYSTAEDTALAIAAPGVLSNDQDDAHHLLKAIQMGDVTRLALDENGAFNYTPSPNFFGVDTFYYKATDGIAESQVVSIAITVNPINDAPVAHDDQATTSEGTPVIIPVLTNDSDVDGDPLTITQIGNAAQGTAVADPAQMITYTPAPQVSGSDRFTYTICDPGALCATAAVTVVSGGVNDPPVATNDQATTPEDTPVTINVAANDSDPDGNLRPGSAMTLTNPISGVVASGGNGLFTYTPNRNRFGLDHFRYTICDDGAPDGVPLCASATVTVAVTPVNDAPLAQDDGYAASEDTPFSVAAPGVLANDQDVDGDPLTVNNFSQPAHGVLAQNPDGAFTYTPAADYCGVDSYGYTSSDDQLAASATVTLTLTCRNDPPLAPNDLYTVTEGASLTVAAPGLLTNDRDPDGDPLTVSNHTQPAHGALTQSADGALSYTPQAGFCGADSYTYTVVDNQGGSAEAVVSLNVSCVNDPPTASITSPPAGASFPAPATIIISADATDEDGSVAKVEFLAGDSLLGEDASAPFGFDWLNVPAGDYTLTVRATDNLGATTVSSAVQVTVTSLANQPPSVAITGPANGTSFTAPANITISANATDPDGTIAKVEFFADNNKIGEDTASPFVAEWSNVAAGSYVLTAKATDNQGESATSAPVQITVNTPPTDPFTVTVGPSNLAIMQGQSGSYAITLNSSQGFNQLAQLSVSGLPDGVHAAFIPTQITTGQTAVLSITVLSDQAITSSQLQLVANATVADAEISKANAVTLNVQPVTTSFVGRTVVADAFQSPLAGVTITLLGRDGNGATTGCSGQTVSDAAGNFALTNLPPTCLGGQLIRYDGSTVTNAPGQYAGVDLFYTLKKDQVVVSPVLIHLPRIDNAETVLVRQNLLTDQVFTFAAIPNLSVTVYAGTIFRLIDGSTPDPFPLIAVQVPVDRLPDEMPPGMPTITPFIVAFQPPNAEASQPVAVAFPNTVNTPPGAHVELTTLDPTKGVMVMYGTGTVAADGTQIIPDLDPARPGHRYGLVHFDWHGPLVPSDEINLGQCPIVQKGDPIDLAAGLAYYSTTDLEINSPLGWIGVVRTYRSASLKDGPFGLGSTHNYDYQLNTNDLRSATINLVMPAGNQYPFVRQANETLINTTTPMLRGAVLSAAGSQARLRWKDGTIYEFTPAIYSINFGGVTREYRASVLTAIVDANGNRVTIERNPNRMNLVTKVTSPTGHALYLEYNDRGHITSIRDNTGRQVRYQYLGTINVALSSVTDAAGGVTRYEYEYTTLTGTNPLPIPNLLAKTIDPRGVVMAENTYQGQRVVAQRRADGGVWRFAYILLNPSVPTSPVLETHVVDPLGHPSSYRFNPEGFLLDMTDATGQKRILNRESGTNQITSITGTGLCEVCGAPGAGDQFFTYDALGNLLTMRDAVGATTTSTYEPTFNKPATVRDALGNTTTFTYDNHGNLLTVVDANQHTTQVAYNSFGQVTEIIDPSNTRTRLSYDTFNNLRTVTDALGQSTALLYDALARPIALTDVLGRTTRIEYDSLDRVRSVTDPQSHTTHFTYDAIGNPLTVTDAKGHTTTFGYNSQGRLERRTTQAGRVERYTYDSGDRLTSFVDRRGQASQFAYDQVGRLVAERYQDGSRVDYRYDAYSRLVRAEDSVGGNFDFAYDVVGQLLSNAGPFGTVRYRYDALGRVTTRQVTDQPAVDYTYDAVSNLLTASTTGAGVTFTYDERDQVRTMLRSNGVESTYTYDPLGRVLSLIHANGATVLNSQNYVYDAIGNRASYTTDIAQPLITQPRTSVYDDENRLISSTDANGTTNYTYDANGNLTSASGAAGATTYTWDARNQLSTINTSDGNTITLRYDFAGNMIEQATTGAEGSSSTRFILDDLTNVAAMSDNSGNQFAMLTGRDIDQHFALISPDGQREFGLTDALNSTVLTSDQNDVQKASFAYTPFGQTTDQGSSNFLFQYTGRVPVFDDLYYYRARFYDANLGRFTSEDPIGFVGQDVNLYRYVANNPINYTDPSGKVSILQVVKFLAQIAAIILLTSGHPTIDSSNDSLINQVNKVIIRVIRDKGKLKEALRPTTLPTRPNPAACFRPPQPKQVVLTQPKPLWRFPWPRFAGLTLSLLLMPTSLAGPEHDDPSHPQFKGSKRLVP